MLAITPGEPAGIGPDLVVEYAQSERATGAVVFASAELLSHRAAMLGYKLIIDNHVDTPSRSAGTLTVVDHPVNGSLAPGQPDIKNVTSVLAGLDAAIDACLKGRLQGLVTGPMQKSIVNEAGVPFSGHTEYLATKSGVDDVVMLLVAGEFRVALATTHLPLADVASSITQRLLERRLKILHAGLQSQFQVADPQLYVAGLNPHAGEGGYLGREEIEIIAPVCRQLLEQGLKVTGPLPADTLFTPKYVPQADAFMAMYHDQGLPVLKYAGFGQAVNVTLGLPFVRVSVDHGTALDVAGTGRAEVGSFDAAYRLGEQMLAGRASG